MKQSTAIPDHRRDHRPRPDNTRSWPTSRCCSHAIVNVHQQVMTSTRVSRCSSCCRPWISLSSACRWEGRGGERRGGLGDVLSLAYHCKPSSAARGRTWTPPRVRASQGSRPPPRGSHWRGGRENECQGLGNVESQWSSSAYTPCCCWRWRYVNVHPKVGG